jgi:hypothetical protein
MTVYKDYCFRVGAVPRLLGTDVRTTAPALAGPYA